MVTFVLYDYLKQCSFGMEGREIMKDSTNRGFWQRTAKLYAPFMKGSASLYDAIYTHCLPYLTPEMEVLDKTTPRLIQFHTLKNAVNPPFLGGFSIFNTVVA